MRGERTSERGIPSDVIARIPNKHSAAPAKLLIWLIASQELRGDQAGIPSRRVLQNAAPKTLRAARVMQVIRSRLGQASCRTVRGWVHQGRRY